MLSRDRRTQSIRVARVALIALMLFGLQHHASAQESHVVIPQDLEFARGLVSDLDAAGIEVKSVRYSKFNGGELWTQDAAWIKTGKGVLEAVFYDDPSKPTQIKLNELPSKPGFHDYKITFDRESRKWGGTSPVFFIPYRNALIVCYDLELSRALKAFADRSSEK